MKLNLIIHFRKWKLKSLGAVKQYHTKAKKEGALANVIRLKTIGTAYLSNTAKGTLKKRFFYTRRYTLDSFFTSTNAKGSHTNIKSLIPIWVSFLRPHNSFKLTH
ncbi:hypothetical protein BLX87_19705 [Bacillus sp. VT-16-64]|nr:hypothetical protein BLX87_19705 [Bacillus sp. VT-16-64]